jgi:hypothetical protein
MPRRYGYPKKKPMGRVGVISDKRGYSKLLVGSGEDKFPHKILIS